MCDLVSHWCIMVVQLAKEEEKLRLEEQVSVFVCTCV